MSSDAEDREGVVTLHTPGSLRPLLLLPENRPLQIIATDNQVVANYKAQYEALYRHDVTSIGVDSFIKRLLDL